MTQQCISNRCLLEGDRKYVSAAIGCRQVSQPKEKCMMEEWLHNACGRVSMLRSHHRAFGVEPGI